MDLSQPNEIAMRLHQLGVSRKAVLDLINLYPWDIIEQQLDWLPHRKARRPEAFVVDAIRHNYSAPKEIYYASHKAPHSKSPEQLDQDPEPFAGQPAPETQGHRAKDSVSFEPPHGGLESGGTDADPLIPNLDIEDWPSE